MDNYLITFREMISLRGLTDHTLKNYCTYVRAYLDYLSRILHKSPEDVSWSELRDYIRWLKIYCFFKTSPRKVCGACPEIRMQDITGLFSQLFPYRFLILGFREKILSPYTHWPPVRDLVQLERITFRAVYLLYKLFFLLLL